MFLKIILIGLLVICSWVNTCAQGVSVQKLPFSKKHVSEIAPFLQDSVLYFSTNKNVKWATKPTDQDNQNFYNLFATQQNVDSSWTRAKQYLPSYFSDFHTSTISFHPTSNEVYFTEVHYKNRRALRNSTTKNHHGVYMADVSQKGLSPSVSLPFNSNRNYSTGHPTISEDGRFLIFASNKDGGYGQADLYISERINNTWGEATNLGDVINTEGKELFPFYHPSGKLYFASDGHGGQGGLDLFYTMLTADGWSKPIALEEGINTSADDFSCFINRDEQSGYFASTRDGDDDLYEFTQLFPIFGPGKKQKENTFRYRFYDRMNGKGDGPVKYVWHFGDGNKADGDTVIHKYKKPGSYHVQSILVDTVENVELFVLNDFFQEVQPKVQVYISVPDTVQTNQPYTLDAKKSNFGEFKPNGYYWEMPDGSKQKGIAIQYIFREPGKQRIKCGSISQNDPHKKMCTYKEIIVTE